MDIQFWIWLIIIVATLLSRAMKKSAQRREGPTDEAPTTDREPDHKPMSFEELLREIQASKTPEQPKQVQSAKPIQPARPIQKFDEVDYDEEIEEEEKDLETIPSDDNRSYEVYEKAKTEAFYRPSLEETMKLSDTVVKYDHFKGYDTTKEKTVANDILANFKDPEGFKKAFIMSEILKRKF